MRRAQSGFSLIEMIVTVAISGVLFMLVIQLMTMMNQRFQKFSDDAMNELDAMAGMKSVEKDIQSIEVSFNNLSVADDGGRNFFDYYFDFPAFAMDADKRSRTLTLKLTGPSPRPEVTFMVADDASGGGFIYDPKSAYHVNNPPSDETQPGTVTYLALNNGGAVDKRAPGQWSNGRFFLLYAPVPFRPVSPSGHVDMKATPPRYLIHFGTVAGQDLAPTTLGGLVRNTHPVNPALAIDTPDKFFRHVPPVGGAASMVIMQPVKLVRLKLAHALDKGKQVTRLLRAVNNNGTWSDDVIILNNVGGLVLKRDLISLPAISLQVLPGAQ